VRHQVHFSGTAQYAVLGATVGVQRNDPKAGWITIAMGQVGAGGIFTANWKADRSGVLAFRAVLVPPGTTVATTSQTGSVGASLAAAASTRAAQADATGSPTLDVTVYRPAIATFFGPGFYGQQTACGEILEPDTLGVASRTLRCGTQVSIAYGGHTIVVPVIDRGPYANHADWDLTAATATALGMTDTETIGAATVAGPAIANTAATHS
jgi:hypothetical protein